MTTIKQLANEIYEAMEYRESRNGYFIKDSYDKLPIAETIRSFIFGNIAGNYFITLNLDYQYQMFYDAISTIVNNEWYDRDDIDFVEVAPASTNTLIDLLKDGNFRSCVDEKISEYGNINDVNAITNIISLTYDSMVDTLMYQLLDVLEDLSDEDEDENE
jgi:hypothetical protein